MKWPTMIVVSSSSALLMCQMIVSPLDLDCNTRQIVPYKLGSDRFGICRPFSVQESNLMPSPVPSLF